MTTSSDRREPRETAELQKSGAQWRAVLDSAQDAIISIDLDGRISLFNPAAERIFGYRAAEVIGQDVALLMPSPYRDEHASYLEAYQRTRQARAIGRTREVAARRQNGEVFPIELSVSEARLADAVAYVAIIRDVSERKRFEQALLESEGRYRAIVESVLDGIIVIDDRGTIESLNSGAERIFGYAPNELIGQNVRCLMPSPYREEHDDYVAHYLRTGRRKIIGVGRELVGQRKDGTIFPLHLGVSEVQLGERRRFTSLIQDLTQRKRTEAQLRDLEKVASQRQRLADIGAITAKIVHDLGNPLGGLSMQMQRLARLLKRDPTTPLADAQEPIERISAIVKRLDNLVRNFMNFAREQRLDLRPIAVRPFLEDIVEQWRPMAMERAITLSCEAPAGPVTIRADVEKLRRVIENLLKNAIEAIDAGPGEIAIRVGVPESGKMHIVIEDTGPGVSEGIEVFQLFETTKSDGSGFGLAIAKQIVIAHGGNLEYAPREPHGAAFRIELATVENPRERV